MKITEALRLGSTLIAPLPGSVGMPGGPGCAMGMILEAVGRGYLRRPDLPSSDLPLPEEWRWIGRTKAMVPPHEASLQCQMIHVTEADSNCWLAEHPWPVDVCIMHLFDAGWSANQIADWLEPIEAEEESRVVECEARNQTEEILTR